MSKENRKLWQMRRDLGTDKPDTHLTAAALYAALESVDPDCRVYVAIDGKPVPVAGVGFGEVGGKVVVALRTEAA